MMKMSPLTIEVKLTKIGNSLRITIPKDVLRALNWKEGDKLEIGLNDSVMIVKKATGKTRYGSDSPGRRSNGP